MGLSEEEIYNRVSNGTLTKEDALELLKRLYSHGQQEAAAATEAAVMSRSAARPSRKESEADVQAFVVDIVRRILHLEEDEIEQTLTFKELGADSISSVEIVRDINKSLRLNLDAVVLYDFSTIQSLVDHIASIIQRDSKVIAQPSAVQQSVVVSPPVPKLADAEARFSENAVQAKIVEIVCGILHLGEEELNTSFSFRELGIDSISAVEIVRDLNKTFKLNLDAVTLYDYATISSLAEHVNKVRANSGLVTASAVRLAESDTMRAVETAQQAGGRQKLVLSKKKSDRAEPELTQAPPSTADKQPSLSGEAVAIIGIAGRFPGADNVHEFWNNLRDGVDSVTEVPRERWNIDDYYDPDPHAPGKTNCRKGGFLRDADQFDPLFFNISPREAAFMDPQQRLFLQEAWNALEDAGYTDMSLSGRKCGVFAGVAMGDYAKLLAEQGLETLGESFSGLATSILAARISYFLNLTGPSMAIETACSSSLVAIHQACQSLLSGDCDMALAGGVSLMLTPDLHIKSSMIEMISPSGKCRSFDAGADGAVFSEGVGVLVLKPLTKALEDSDPIYGVIKGSAVNQDGKTNGITAPSARSQTQLESDIYRKHYINPDEITYMEAHGTGTPLGDPIEIKALTESFELFTQRRQYCAIGSVKSNIGHASTAAGVISVIKVLLALKHGQIPPSLHFEQPNPHIRFEETPFYVNTRLMDWKVDGGKPRIAGISAFGFSGTNCHMIIQEAQ
ncbi:type I polyketide synthase [Paenibacillus harenae]|uniref:type I polyketide synthase n=1 Tax=Paenibacillus harenae TaxID=306543 RepID=UPI0027942A9A|nr:type I polyketide synthase [Paenibacillus harenae]MDQ0059017.1 polyketide synthase PksL [Paenibacillus harenae]